jgi:hypothetical protein
VPAATEQAQGTHIIAGQRRWRWDLNPRKTCAFTRFRVLRTTVHWRPRTSLPARTSGPWPLVNGRGRGRMRHKLSHSLWSAARLPGLASAGIAITQREKRLPRWPPRSHLTPNICGQTTWPTAWRSCADNPVRGVFSQGVSFEFFARGVLRRMCCEPIGGRSVADLQLQLRAARPGWGRSARHLQACVRRLVPARAAVLPMPGRGAVPGRRRGPRLRPRSG